MSGDSPAPRAGEEVPEEVRQGFLERLRAALRGDEAAARELGEVLEAADRPAPPPEQERGLVARALGLAGRAAGSVWETATSWSRLRSFVTGTTQALLIETFSLAFKTILTVPLGAKLTGDTARLAAVRIKTVLYYLNGTPIPPEDEALQGEYVEEVKRITGYLSSLGLRAGLFALPGIGALASATIGKWLEGKIRESFPQDPKIVAEIQQLIPK